MEIIKDYWRLGVVLLVLGGIGTYLQFHFKIRFPPALVVTLLFAGVGLLILLVAGYFALTQ